MNTKEIKHRIESLQNAIEQLEMFSKHNREIAERNIRDAEVQEKKAEEYREEIIFLNEELDN